jgi:hypothetical protein
LAGQRQVTSGSWQSGAISVLSCRFRVLGRTRSGWVSGDPPKVVDTLQCHRSAGTEGPGFALLTHRPHCQLKRQCLRVSALCPWQAAQRVLGTLPEDSPFGSKPGLDLPSYFSIAVLWAAPSVAYKDSRSPVLRVGWELQAVLTGRRVGGTLWGRAEVKPQHHLSLPPHQPLLLAPTAPAHHHPRWN